jgi:hypothetical protein
MTRKYEATVMEPLLVKPDLEIEKMQQITFVTIFGEVELSISEPDAEGRRSGRVLCEFVDADSEAICAVESMILAHACAGVDVAAPAYISGIETALEAIANEA